MKHALSGTASLLLAAALCAPAGIPSARAAEPAAPAQPAGPGSAPAPAAGVCLTRVTEVVPGGIAERAGMMTGDLIISIEGNAWTVFDSMGPDCRAMGGDVRAHMLPRRDEPGTVFVLYRPAPGEQGEARGRIVRLAPAEPGPKGYTYSTSNRGETYRKNTSGEYAAQIRRLYEQSR